MSLSSGSKTLWSSARSAFLLITPRSDPWLTFPCNFFAEPHKDGLGAHLSNGRSIYLLETLKRLILVDIVTTEEDAIDDIDRSGTLKPSLCNTNLSEGAHKEHRPWPVCKRAAVLGVVAGLIILPALHIQTGSYLLFERDRLIKLMSLQAPNSSKLNGTKCIYQSEISKAGQTSRRQLDEADKRLKDFGVCPNVASVSLLLHALMSFGAIFFYLITPLLLSLRPTCIHHLVYLTNPSAERKRLIHKMKRIVQVFSGAIGESVVQYTEAFTDCIVQQIDEHNTKPTTECGQTNVQRASSCKTHDLIYRAAEVELQHKYKTLLADLIDRQLVRPLPLSSEWHSELEAFTRLAIAVMFSFSFLIPIVFAIGLIAIELYLRTSARLELFECQARFGAFAANDTVHLVSYVTLLAPLASKHDKLNYLSTVDLIMSTNTSELAQFLLKAKLVLKIEAKNYFNGQKVAFLISYCCVAATLSLSTSFYALAYVTGMLNKLAWLEQIICQLSYCIHLSRLDKATTAAERCGRLRCDPIDSLLFRKLSDEDAHKHLAHLLMLTLINFELFRREHRPFKRAANFLAFQMCAYCTVALLVCYIDMIYSVPEFKNYILVCIFFLALALNLYIGYSSYLASRADKLMHTVAKLVALFPAQDLTKDDVSELYLYDKSLALIAIAFWRRYLFAKKETRHLFAPNLFGYSLNFQRLVSANAYTIAFCLLLLRPETERAK